MSNAWVAIAIIRMMHLRQPPVPQLARLLFKLQRMPRKLSFCARPNTAIYSTLPSKSLASLWAQAACQTINTHFGILTLHGNHKLGLFSHHKLIDGHELCIWCESQGQLVAVYFTETLFKTTENNCKFNENRHFTKLAMDFYEWLEYETFFMQLEFMWWTCKNIIDWHVSCNNMT